MSELTFDPERLAAQAVRVAQVDGRLMLDLDGVSATDFDVVAATERVRGLLDRAGFTLVGTKYRASPSGTGTHVVLTIVPDPAPLEVVALQAILGSDPFREAYNLGRVRVLDRVPEYWRERWNVLYSSTGVAK